MNLYEAVKKGIEISLYPDPQFNSYRIPNRAQGLIKELTNADLLAFGDHQGLTIILDGEDAVILSRHSKIELESLRPFLQDMEWKDYETNEAIHASKVDKVEQRTDNAQANKLLHMLGKLK